jgi:methyl-accepting chemotaxis protein
MLEGSQQVISESRNLENVTQEISDAVNEMAAGSDQITSSVAEVHTLSGENKDGIDALVAEVSKFKV